MKYLKNASLLVACFAVSACSLPSAKKPGGASGSGLTEMCPSDMADGGAGTDGGTGGSVATFPIDRVVQAMACSGDGVANPRAIDKYTQGYTRNQADVDRATTTVSNMSTPDLAAQ